ncbi:MAG: TonB-dependent receptor [bacterium]
MYPTQKAFAADQNSDSEQSTSLLEEVIVTAQKRDENLQEVPLSVSALDTETLDTARAGGSDIRFMSGRTPSLIIESDFGRVFPRFYIRGIGNTDFDLNASQPVSLIYDDVVMENPMLKGFPIFDVQHVETLRGPQGTLFGRNTPAGIVKIDSVKPTQDFDAYAKVGYGSFGFQDYEGAVGGALNNQWSARFSFLHQQRDDWVDNRPGLIDPDLTFVNGSANGDGDLEEYSETAYRAQLAYSGENVDISLNLHGRSLDGTARVFRANIIQPGTNDFIPSYNRRVVSFDGGNSQSVDSTGFAGKIVWDLGEMTLTSVTGYETVEAYSRGDVDGGYGSALPFPPFSTTPSGPGFIPFPAQTADGIPNHSQFTQEIRLSSNENDGFAWQAGVFYFDEHLEVESFNFDDLSEAFSGYATQEQDTSAYAFFGQGDWSLNEKTTLTAGLRYSKDKKDYNAAVPIAPFGAPPVPKAFVNTDDGNISGNLSINYAVNDQTNVYGRIARGFRAPSIQGRVLFGGAITVADSETVTSFEAGIKNELMDGNLRLNASVYHYIIRNQQLTAGSGSANVNQLVNADKTVGQGLEVDLQWAINENALLTLGTSYNDTEIQDPNLTITPCGGGCAFSDPAGAIEGTVSIDGNPLPRSPKWISNVTFRYSVPMGEDELYFYTDWAYRSEINFFLYEAPEFRGKSLLEGGLRVGYLRDNYEVALYGRNITNEDQLIAGIDFNNLEGIVNDPRTWGGEFIIHF